MLRAMTRTMLVAEVALAIFAGACSAAAQTNVTAAPATRISAVELSEQWRARCIAERRSLCGRIVRVFSNGILVEFEFDTPTIAAALPMYK